MADDIETLAESERALLAKAGDHHPETCDCSVYAEDGGYPEHDICTGLSETFAAVETILTSRTTSSGRPSNERDGECICNYGPDTDGPDECCPFHGRPYSYWVDAVGELTARHDADIAAARAAGAAEVIARALAVLDAEVTETIERKVRSARGDVRCIDCNLRYDERDQYGCHIEGHGHDYDDGDLSAAEEIERSEPIDYVTLKVADLRDALTTGGEGRG